MELICRVCGRNINDIFQDNMSHTLGAPICEDCAEKD